MTKPGALRKVIKQPNGRWALWCDLLEEFSWINAEDTEARTRLTGCMGARLAFERMREPHKLSDVLPIYRKRVGKKQAARLTRICQLPENLAVLREIPPGDRV